MHTGSPALFLRHKVVVFVLRLVENRYRRLKSSTHLQLAQFMPVLLLPVGGGAAPDFDLEGGEPRPPEVLVEPGGRFILL